MDERVRFVIRLKDGESMAALCREFGISRKTGYKIFERYEECGLEGLTDRARRPHRYANQLPAQIEAAIVAAKREKPNWGARKIRERLLRRLPHEVKVPARSTVQRGSLSGYSINPLVTGTASPVADQPGQCSTSQGWRRQSIGVAVLQTRRKVERAALADFALHPNSPAHHFH